MPSTTKHDATKLIKTNLEKAFRASQVQDLEKANLLLEEVNSSLNKNKRFMVRPKSNCMLPIMGRTLDIDQPRIHMRAMLVESQHSFYGKSFHVTTKGEIVLKINGEPNAPWCQLSFNSQTNEPNFYLETV